MPLHRLVCFVVLLTGLAVFALPPALAQSAGPSAVAPRPGVTAVRTAAPPDVDGDLSDAAWAAASPASGFVQREPRPGAAASERTEVRLLYDGSAMYVGARLYDAAPDSVVARLLRRDDGGFSDWFYVAFDSYDDDRTGFVFGVNPRGVQHDFLIFDDTNEDDGWDAVWDAEARVDSLGWTVEMRVPLSQLRYERGPGELAWGVQFQRVLARRNEASFWSPTPPTEAGLVSLFGSLEGLRELPPSRRVELRPYVSTRLTRGPGDAADPFYSANALAPGAGLDAKVGLTSGLTLSATVNPDFGQVEVDPAEVNLSVFETFFPERRPFFLEGAEQFQFASARSTIKIAPPLLFYSRRIGQPPVRQLVGGGYAYAEAPELTTIAGAAKVSGQLGRGWTLGLLDAVTPEERARYVSPDGAEGVEVVEPLTNYFVGRLRRDVSGGAHSVGAFGTAVHRRVGALSPLVRSSAVVGGADFQTTWADRAWSLSGYVAGSHVAGSEEAIAATQRRSVHYFQRPDADHVTFDPSRTSLAGHAVQLALNKQGGRWRGSVFAQQTSPGFEANDLGYLSTADSRALGLLLVYAETTPGRLFRTYELFGYTVNQWNFGGARLTNGVRLQGVGRLHSNWLVRSRVEADLDRTSDRQTRGGPLLALPRGVGYDVGVFTDDRRALSGYAGAYLTADEAGGWTRQATAEATWRPSPAVQVGVGPSVEWQHETQQYVRTVADPRASATFGARYVFASLDQTTVAASVRADWTFTPTLSLQVYAQPFLASGRYDGFKELAAPATREFAVYGVDQGSVSRDPSGAVTVDPGDGPEDEFGLGNPDFTVRSLRGNAVLRWEWRPGSTFFLVWQQEREDLDRLGDVRLGRDASELFRVEPRNVFLAKLTYFIG